MLSGGSCQLVGVVLQKWFVLVSVSHSVVIASFSAAWNIVCGSDAVFQRHSLHEWHSAG